MKQVRLLLLSKKLLQLHLLQSWNEGWLCNNLGLLAMHLDDSGQLLLLLELLLRDFQGQG